MFKEEREKRVKRSDWREREGISEKRKIKRKKRMFQEEEE